MLASLSAAALLTTLYLVLRLPNGFAQHDWSYDNPQAWPTQCKVGKRQSPIDLRFKRSILHPIDPFVFIKYDDLYHYEVSNTGHYIKLKLDQQQCTVGVTGGALHGFYVLDHIHFHWRAEHTMDGVRLPMEAHFVHYRKEYGSVAEALKHPDGLAVLGVLFKKSNEDNKVLSEWLPYISNKTEPVAPKSHLSPAGLLPADKGRKGFYRYWGSLTNPPCAESVLWTVFVKPLPISQAQIDQLYSVTFNGETENWRQVQPTNKRPVYLLTPREDYRIQLNCSKPSKSQLGLCVLMAMARALPFQPPSY